MSASEQGILIDSYPDLNLFGFVVRSNVIFIIASKVLERLPTYMQFFLKDRLMFSIESFL
jgi:hypothetical protein